MSNREAHDALDAGDRITPDVPVTLEHVHEEELRTQERLLDATKRLDNFAERAEHKADEFGHTVSGLAKNQLAFDTRLGRVEGKQDATLDDLRRVERKQDETKNAIAVVNEKLDRIEIALSKLGASTP